MAEEHKQGGESSTDGFLSLFKLLREQMDREKSFVTLRYLRKQGNVTMDGFTGVDRLSEELLWGL